MSLYNTDRRPVDVALFRALIATAVDEIIVTDVLDTVRLHNESPASLFGQTPDEGIAVGTFSPAPYRGGHCFFFHCRQTAGEIHCGGALAPCGVPDSEFHLRVPIVKQEEEAA